MEFKVGDKVRDVYGMFTSAERTGIVSRADNGYYFVEFDKVPDSFTHWWYPACDLALVECALPETPLPFDEHPAISAEVAMLQARIRELETALRPFAWAGAYDRDIAEQDDAENLSVPRSLIYAGGVVGEDDRFLCVRHLRQAAAVLHMGDDNA